MTTASLAGAELLKLRKRRGLVTTTLALTIGPMLVAYAVLVLMHASAPAEHGPAGGAENFGHSIRLLSQLLVVAASLVGVTAGAGDLRAGVFRELVVTGRPRLVLFAARVPGAFAFLAPALIAAFTVAATASTALAGSLDRPSLTLLVEAGAWVALGAAANLALALGVASLLGSTTTSVAALLGWNFAVIPVLQVIENLGDLRGALLPVALERLQPAGLSAQAAADSPLAAAVVAVAGWSFVPLALGAWRTATRDG